MKMKKIVNISLAFGLATLLVGCGSGNDETNSKTKDFTISDGWVVDAGKDANGTAQEIKIGDLALVHQGNGIWRATYTSDLTGNLVVPKTAIVDDGDGVFDALKDIVKVGFEMKAPVDYNMVTPLTTAIVENGTLFTDEMKAQIKAFDPVKAMEIPDNIEAQNMLKLTQVAKTYAQVAEVNDAVKLNDFNFSAVMCDTNFNSANLDNEILSAMPDITGSNVKETMTQDINQTINSVNKIVDFATEFKALGLDANSYNSVMQSTIMQVFDNDKNLTAALDTLNDFDSTQLLTDFNLADVTNQLNTISAADTQIQSMISSSLALNYPSLSLDNFNLNDIDSTVANITSLLSSSGLSLDSFSILDNFKNLGLGFDMSQITDDISFQTDIKYNFSYSTSKYLTASIADLNISINKNKEVSIENLSTLLGDNDKYTVNVKSNITGSIDENISVDKSFLTVGDSEQLTVNAMRLFTDISSQISGLSNFDMTLVSNLAQENNKTVTMGLGFSTPHNLVDDKLQILTGELNGYKGYEITINDSYSKTLYENLISFKDLAQTLPVNLDDFNISDIANFDITNNMSNLNLDFLSKIVGDFNSTVATKTKLITTENSVEKFMTFTSDAIDLVASSSGITSPNLEGKNVVVVTDIIVNPLHPLDLFNLFDTSGNLEVSIPLSSFVKTEEGKLNLDINSILDAVKGKANTGNNTIDTYINQGVDLINDKMESADNVDIINGFKFTYTNPAVVQTLIDTILPTLSETGFDGYRGLKTRMK